MRLCRATVAPAVLFALLAAGCAQTAQTASDPTPSASSSHGSHASKVTVSGGGQFTDNDSAAIAYDRKLAPEGAQASLTAESVGGKTVSSLVVEGMLPDRHYGAHLHAKPCGAKPDDAGPHYQHATHGADAKKASEKNEVWLDLKTDKSGTGRATSRQSWALDPANLPRSLVLHAEPTKKSGPETGSAGPRVACLTLS